ncbi:MAG: DciA family protein [Gallionella sp.]|nr:DciA family protein [Gallionella sp.]
MDSNQDLRRLSQRVDRIAAFQRHYQQLVPASLSRSSHVMQMDGQTLILAADNGAVAAKLRQISSELISSFLTRGCEVTGIQIRVQVRIKPQILTSPARKVGQNGKRALEELAGELADSPLKSALKRLARRS